MKKKILIYSLPNAGHFNILKMMTNQYYKKYTFSIVIIDRQNTPPNLSGIKVPVIFLKGSRKFKNTQTSAIFTRVNALLGECLAVAEKFKPDLIIYDFPAIEGYFVAKILDIHYWCSIPGMIGPFIHHKYLKRTFSSKKNIEALKQIKTNYGLTIKKEQVEVISNCFHIPGQVNLLWSYPTITPRNFRKGRIKAKYIFIGYLKPKHLVIKKAPSPNIRLYFSLGTEVMDNLWLMQKKTRLRIKQLIDRLNKLWSNRPYQILFVTQKKRVLPKYASNWIVKSSVNQQKTLLKSDLFITHAGSNSFHEAILHKIPMIFIPFFGDQPLVSKRGKKLGIGINLVKDDWIEKQKDMSFLNTDLVTAIDKAVQKILSADVYKKNISSLRLPHTRLGSLLNKEL